MWREDRFQKGAQRRRAVAQSVGRKVGKDEIVGAGQGADARHQIVRERFGAAGAARTERDEPGDHREQVLDAVVHLTKKQFLPLCVALRL